MTPLDHDVLRLRNHPAGLVARLCLLVALGLFSLTAYASTYPIKMRADGQRIMNSVLGPNNKLSVAGGGQPVTSSLLNGYIPSGASSTIGVAADGSSLKYGARALVPLEAGRTVAVDVVGGISKASLAKGVRNLAGGPLGLAILAGTAVPHIVDWMQDSGLTIEDGQVKKGDPDACTVAPCYEKYNYRAGPLSGYDTCQALGNALQAAFGGGARYCEVVADTLRVCESPSNCATVNYDTRTVDPVENAYTPATPQEIEDALMESNAPPGAARELLDNGQELDIEAPTVSGPASTPGPAKQINRPDGKIETQTTTHNHTYEGDTVTTTITNVTNIYNPVTDTTETTTEEREPEDERRCKDGDQTLACAELGQPPEDEIPKSTFDITFVPENLFGAGTCPSWPSWTDALGTHTLDFTGYCTLASTVIRPLLLAFALLAAIFIVAPVGGKD